MTIKPVLASAHLALSEAERDLEGIRYRLREDRSTCPAWMNEEEYYENTLTLISLVAAKLELIREMVRLEQNAVK